VPDRDDALRRLPTSVRARLEAFAEALDQVPTSHIALLGARPMDTVSHERARAAADERIQWHGWQEPMSFLRGELLRWMAGRFSRRIPLSETLGYVATSDNFRVMDELRIGQSLADALRAVAVWDEIDEGYRNELLGAWAAIVSDDPAEAARSAIEEAE
jgi:hypothetical protein